MIIFINNKSTKFCQITLLIKQIYSQKNGGSLFLPHGVVPTVYGQLIAGQLSADS